MIDSSADFRYFAVSQKMPLIVLFTTVANRVRSTLNDKNRRVLMKRRNFISRLGVLAVALFAFATTNNTMVAPAKAASPAPEKTTVIHLTKAPDKQGMNEVDTGEAATLALQLGNLMQGTNGRTAIFLSLDGTFLAHPSVVVNIPTIYNPDYPDQDGAEPGLLQAFLEAGGRVVVCPSCAVARGLASDTILPGIEWGSPASISELFNKSKQIISF
jgi:sulfur relay (sulfurtransferase) complex TusBCD TusD component (DsrE family)